MINRLIVLIMILAFAKPGYLKSQSPDAISDDSLTNLFEYGLPLKDCESNMINFFANISKYTVDNSIAFISYKEMGNIKSKNQIKKFMKRNLKPDLWNLNMTTAMGGTDAQMPIEMWFSEIPKNRNHNSKRENKQKSEILINEMSNKYVQIGYKVYLAYFSYKSKTYDYYFFINPTTKQVVLENNFWGIRFPRE